MPSHNIPITRLLLRNEPNNDAYTRAVEELSLFYHKGSVANEYQTRK